MNQKALERFWAKVDKSGECWLWTGAKHGSRTHKYGAVTINRKQYEAHRAIYEATYGCPIPVGMQILHKCDISLCVRPDHLMLGTHTDNMRDRNEKGRQARGERVNCPDRKGARNPFSKLSDQDVRSILESTERQAVLGRRFGVCRQVIWGIKHGKGWQHVLAFTKGAAGL